MEPVGCEYPKEFPLAELRRLIGYARGSLPFDLRGAIHDAYHVLGFALGTVVGDVPAPVGAAKASAFTGSQTEAAEALQRAVDSHAVQGVDPKTVGFDWTVLIPVLVTLIQRWLDGRK